MARAPVITGPNETLAASWTKSNPIWIYLFLFPAFFQRVFIGGYGAIDSYDDLSGTSTIVFGYGAHLLVCLRYLIQPRNLVLDANFRLVFLPLLLISALHVLLLLWEPIGSVTAMLGIARSLFWLLACVAVCRYSNERDFLSAVVNLVHATFVVIVVTAIAFRITGVPYQMLMFGEVPRAQGFLSEPSGVGTFLAGYVAYALTYRKYWWLAPAGAALLLANSVIAFIGVGAAVAFYAINQFFVVPKSRVILRRVLLYAVPASFVILALMSGPISSFATQVRAEMSLTSFSQTAVYQIVFDRLLSAMSTLQTGIDLVRSGANVSEGGLFRYTSVLLLLNDLVHSWRGVIGYGLGAHAQLMEARQMSLLDFGFLPLALSSFGLVIGFAVFATVANIISESDQPLAIFAGPFLFVALINSAGGLHGYSVVVVAALLLWRSKRILRLAGGQRVSMDGRPC